MLLSRESVRSLLQRLWIAIRANWKERMNLRSLPLQLFTVLALPLLVLLLFVTFGSVTLHRAAMRDLATNHDVQAVRSIAAGVSGRLEQKESVLREIADRAVQTR